MKRSTRSAFAGPFVAAAVAGCSGGLGTGAAQIVQINLVRIGR